MLRAEQWLMLGVVGLGILAVVGLSQASSKAEPPPPGPPEPPPPGPPSPGQPVQPSGPMLSLPELPETPPALPSNIIAITGPTLTTLTANDWYAGRIETVNKLGRPLLGSDPNSVAQALTSLGFGGAAVRPDAPEAAFLPKSVTVFASPADIAGRFPAETAQGAGRGTRWFYGRWTAQAGPQIRPEYLVQLWRAAPPQAPKPRMMPTFV